MPAQRDTSSRPLKLHRVSEPATASDAEPAGGRSWRPTAPPPGRSPAQQRVSTLTGWRSRSRLGRNGARPTHVLLHPHAGATCKGLRGCVIPLPDELPSRPLLVSYCRAPTSVRPLSSSQPARQRRRACSRLPEHAGRGWLRLARRGCLPKSVRVTTLLKSRAVYSRYIFKNCCAVATLTCTQCTGFADRRYRVAACAERAARGAPARCHPADKSAMHPEIGSKILSVAAMPVGRPVWTGREWCACTVPHQGCAGMPRPRRRDARTITRQEAAARAVVGYWCADEIMLVYWIQARVILVYSI